MPLTDVTVETLRSLSPEQRECLRLVAQNYKSKEQARQLGISHHTVDQRLARAKNKLGVATREEAARLLAQAECEGLIYEPISLATPPVRSSDRRALKEEPDAGQASEHAGGGRSHPGHTRMVLGDVGDGHAQPGGDAGLQGYGSTPGGSNASSGAASLSRVDSTRSGDDLRRHRRSFLSWGGPDHELSPSQTWLAILFTAACIVALSSATLWGLSASMGELQRLVGARPTPPQTLSERR